MTKNHNFLFLIILLFGVSFLFGQIFIKYYPFLFRTPVYYCQHAWCSDLIKISSILGTSLFKILIIMLTITFIKSVTDFFRIIRLRRVLIPMITHNIKLTRVERELILTGKIIVVKHPDPFAFCLGFYKAKIIISTAMIKLLKPEELKAVLLHEKYHMENSDALKMFIARFVQSLFPFFPLFGDQVKHLSLDREIKADRQAILLLGNNDPLINSFKKLLSFNIVPAYSTFPSFLESDKNLEFRIKAMVSQEIKHLVYSPRNIIFSLCSLIILLGLLYLPLNTVNVNAVETKEVVACLDSKSCIEACQQEKQKNDILLYQLHPLTEPIK